MVGWNCDSRAPELGHKLGGLFDGLRAIVIGASGPFPARGSASTEDGRAGFAQCRRDPAAGATGRARHDSDTTTQAVGIWSPDLLHLLELTA